MISIELLLLGVMVVSLFTSLLTEAIKKLIDKEKRSDNIVACLCSIVLSLSFGFGYIIYNEILMTRQIIIMIIALVFLSFLCATCGYDKVIQTIKQIRKG